MEQLHVVALTGNPRTGKDALAGALVESHGFYRRAFADPLYDEIALAFRVEADQLRSHEWKTTLQTALQPRRCVDKAFIEVCHKLGYFGDEDLSSRVVCQIWGTDYRRDQQGDDYFARQMRIRPEGRLVIPDLRENVEAAFLFDLVRKVPGARVQIVEVIRDGCEPTPHSSCHGLHRGFIDATITNSGDIAELHHKALKALNLE